MVFPLDGRYPILAHELTVVANCVPGLFSHSSIPMNEKLGVTIPVQSMCVLYLEPKNGLKNMCNDA